MRCSRCIKVRKFNQEDGFFHVFIYRKRVKKERHVSRYDTSNQVKRSGAIDPADFTGLKDALNDKAKKFFTGARKPGSSSTNPAVQDETDEQRLERLKKEEKEKKIAERAEKKKIADAEKAAAATPESITRDKADQILKMASKAKADVSTKINKLKGVKLATTIKDEYTQLLKDMTTIEKDLIAMLSSKRTLEMKKAKDLIAKMAAKIQKKADTDKLAKPHLN